jgi:cystathionine beta-synthase
MKDQFTKDDVIVVFFTTMVQDTWKIYNDEWMKEMGWLD